MVVQYQPSGTTAAEISASVEAGIRDNRLQPGASLPPVRAMAADLGVSPATVAAAYRTLRDRGLIETAGRGGTRVRSRPPLARRLRLLSVPPGALDLASGEPDFALLPDLAPHLKRVSASFGPAGYASGGPLPDLLDLARERFAADAIPTPALTVTAGALDAIERILGAHLRPGDRVAVEDPCWAHLLDLIAALGLIPIAMPVDDDGPGEDGLSAALSAGARAVVVTSRAQNPTGGAVTPARARALKRALRPYPHVLVIEDDHAAQLADGGPAPLAGATDAWAYVRSVSKPYGPDLRLAAMTGDEATVSRVEGRMRLGAGWVSTILQRLVVELWRSPSVASGVAAAAAQYAARRAGLRDALAERGVAARGRTGINLWVPVEDEATVVARLREEGYAVTPGAVYRLAGPSAIRVTTAALPVARADEVADAIARAITGPRTRGSTR